LILHLERENLFNKDEGALGKLFVQRDPHPEKVIVLMNVANREG
jgi:hypothetical protein